MSALMEVAAWHYDGRNANRWPVRLRGDAEQFQLYGGGWDAGRYLWTDLVSVHSAGNARIFGNRKIQGWRLGIEGVLPGDIGALLPKTQQYGGWIDRLGLWKAAGLMATATACIVFLTIKLPGWVAPFIPQQVEDDLGDALLGDFGGRYCRTVDGTAALRRLAKKIDPRGLARSIEIANIPIVNAMALPGRRVIVFRGLVERARSSDEVAGVISHELGHVHHRDAFTALMRQLGLGIALGGVTAGDQINALTSMSFSREAEHKADLYAIERLDAAGISPAATAFFFERQAVIASGTRNPEEVGWYDTHPAPKGRAHLFRTAARREKKYDSSLDEKEWASIQSICVKDATVRAGWNSAFAHDKRN